VRGADGGSAHTGLVSLRCSSLDLGFHAVARSFTPFRPAIGAGLAAIHRQRGAGNPHSASSLARHATAAAISSGWPARRSGICSHAFSNSATSSMIALIIPVMVSLGRRFDRREAPDAGLVHQHVNASEALDGLAHVNVAPRAISHVERNNEGVATVRDVSDSRLLPRGDDDTVPLGEQMLSQRATEAGGAARDQPDELVGPRNVISFRSLVTNCGSAAYRSRFRRRARKARARAA